MILPVNFQKKKCMFLTPQFQRASSDSISLIIAEGSTGQSNKEFNRFPGYALRSAIEVVTCLYFAKEEVF